MKYFYCPNCGIMYAPTPLGEPDPKCANLSGCPSNYGGPCLPLADEPVNTPSPSLKTFADAPASGNPHEKEQ